MEDEKRKLLGEILGIYSERGKSVSWADIFVEIGKLQERANNSFNMPSCCPLPHETVPQPIFDNCPPTITGTCGS